MATAPDYVMTRDCPDNNRINLQHYLSCDIFGYITHPSIPLAQFAVDARIADVGTGTGIWLSDIAHRVPKSVRLDGLDVSFEAAPPQGYFPANVTLLSWDIKTAPPEELAGVYDLVHVRHFSFVLQDKEVNDVLSNLLALLKPGGYLQWTEPDVPSFRVENHLCPGNPGGDASMQLMKTTLPQDDRLQSTWVSRMPELFNEAGFRHVISDKREAPPDLGLAMHECNLALHPILARKIANKEVQNKVEELLPEVCRQTRDGAYLAFTRWTAVGQKATPQSSV
ncbi:S-adenosyl-L-methionine-dependent methyltransferase [Xylariaceae sp. FL1272]|nr:S-adenosyl-L-methionine-dependent methyltransferase [Xylariaceae sp. FL1272]